MSSAQERKLQEALACFHASDLGGAERACSEILRQAPRDPMALHLLGMARLMGGNAGEAVSLLGRAAEGNPDDPALLENLGLAHLAAGEHGKAEAAFRRALGLGASHALLHMRLGLALGGQGKLTEAAAALSAAAGKAPEDPDVHLNLGNTLAEQGRSEEALASYRRVLALQPRYVAAHYNIGTLLKRMGRDEEAISAYQSALALAPDYADAHHNLGMVYQQQGRLEQAAACYRKVLELKPDHIQALNNLGNTLREQGRHPEAVALYERALKANPAHVDAYINLGAALAEQHRYADAQALYEKALSLEPGSVEVHQNLGMLFSLQGQIGAAIKHYRQALEIDSSRVIVHSELGSAYREIADLDSAISCYRKAVELERGSANAYYDLAETLKLQGRLEDAIKLYAQALEREPNHLPALNSLVHTRQHACSWEGLEQQWERLRREMASGADGQLTPFGIMSWTTSAAEQLACAAAWARMHVAPFAAARPALGFDFSRRQPRDKLRIGYLSWGFHRHATSYWAAELFELHDRRRYEVFAYDYGPDDGSEIRARIRNGCDRFIHIAGVSHLAAARRIHDDAIDILVDLTGYTLGARPQITALRPAPVQVSWFYPGTTGTDLMDYFIADPFVVPAGSERFFSEKIMRLPDCYMITDRRREVSDRVPTREECGLPGKGFVFCCFNQAYKILPETFGVWMRILQSVPDSVLWLAEANRWATENLRREAAARGVAGDRVVFAPRKPLGDYMVQYRIAGLALDTFPYTSHTTASDALWMGCPLVTRPGDTFASRVAGSVLTNAGVPELVADNVDHYERLVIGLATAPEKLHDVRRRLQETRLSCPLFDTPRFVRNLEAAYEEMFGAWLRNDTR